MVEFILATVEEAKDIASLRKEIWASTYKGIYSDEILENYNFQSHIKRDKGKILNPKFLVYLIREGQKNIGYLTFSMEEAPMYKDFKVCLNSLYILPKYQGTGIGYEGINIVKAYCRNKRVDKFYNQCNYHNKGARAFYTKLGGRVGNEDIGNAEKIEDTVWFEHIL